ncbi:MAG: ornithine carbamoyltransferase [Gammaproteobacteria bacterium]|nr:ornithine carbamoyltransferase [Gammaproteobacteria bacterium]
MSARHFLTLNDFSAAELAALIRRAADMKRGAAPRPLANKTLAMIFEKSSTRTRVSFEAAMTQLGGSAIFLSSRDTQLGRGEPVEDSARVLSRMVDAVMIRTFDHERAAAFAACSEVPVINGLTDRFHPCQLLADMLTYAEKRGAIAGRLVAWVGDGNNVCHSWINASGLFDFRLNIACPPGYEPERAVLDAAGDRARLVRSPREAVAGADLVVTDVWSSMGQEEEREQRLQSFGDYRVDEALMERAAGDALFMHCLPAHRGEEVSAGVLDGPHSVVWDEAGNRLHAQKALLEMLVGGA